jgi:dUTP pyrophosphatase
MMTEHTLRLNNKEAVMSDDDAVPLDDVKSFKDLGSLVFKMRRLLADYACGKQRARNALGDRIDMYFREVVQREQLYAPVVYEPDLRMQNKVPLLDDEMPEWTPVESCQQPDGQRYALNGGARLTWPQAVIQSRAIDMWELLKTVPLKIQNNCQQVAEECSALMADMLAQIDAERKIKAMTQEGNKEVVKSDTNTAQACKCLGTQKVMFKLAPGCADLAPCKAHPSDAGYDLKSREEHISIWPGDRALVLTGLYIGLPDGYEAQVRPRSGKALKEGITVLNTPGTVDAGYRGEVGVILVNHSKEVKHIHRGDKIAQMVICKLPDVELVQLKELDETDRGVGGFGSTGQ